MIDREELKPPCLNSNIEEIEFLIKGAKEGYLTNEWLCDFISRPLFGLQLWCTAQLPKEIAGGKPQGLIECLETFIKEVEGSIPIWRLQVNRLSEKLKEND